MTRHSTGQISAAFRHSDQDGSLLVPRTRRIFSISSPRSTRPTSRCADTATPDNGGFRTSPRSGCRQVAMGAPVACMKTWPSPVRESWTWLVGHPDADELHARNPAASSGRPNPSPSDTRALLSFSECAPALTRAAPHRLIPTFLADIRQLCLWQQRRVTAQAPRRRWTARRHDRLPMPPADTARPCHHRSRPRDWPPCPHVMLLIAQGTRERGEKDSCSCGAISSSPSRRYSLTSIRGERHLEALLCHGLFLEQR